MTVAARATAERKTFGHPVVTGGDASPVLETAEHDLDPVAALVPALVVLRGHVARLPTWDAGSYPFVSQRIPEPVGVVAAADGAGGAPVITALTTYEVSSPGKTVLIARESASAPGPGLLMSSGFGRAAGTTAAVLGAAAIADHIGHGSGGDTIVNSSYATSGNRATDGGDAGAIDAVTSAFGDCGSDCSVSN